MQNAVYGRFGMKPEGRESVISYDGMPDGFMADVDEESGEISDVLFSKLTIRSTNYMLPHYAAWITANARIELDKDTEALGRGLCRYRDTDSASIEACEITTDRVGTKYGMLKDEGLKQDAMYFGPKNYNWFDPKKNKLDGRMKGIPEKHKTPEFLARVRDGEDCGVDYLSVCGMLTNIKTGKFSVDRKRSVSKPENVYGHDIVDGWFRPKHFMAVES
jgi:hypothetical protein